MAKYFALSLVGGALLTGCVTREDIRGLQTDLYTIQKGLDTRIGNVKDQTDTVQTSQADLLNNIQGLSSNLAALQVELEDNRTRMKQLTLRLDDLETSLSARMDAQIELLSGSKFVETPLPSTVFNLANSDFSRGRYPEAVKGFQNYLKQFPKGHQVSEAKMKIGDSLVKQNQGTAAIEFYDSVIENYPKDPLVPGVMLKKAQVYEGLGKNQSAAKLYETVIKSYSYSSEAKTARERLSSLKLGQ
jgi:tol-pal system protein YbgF